MKPIALTIAGLQSYREAQTIDFGPMTEAGVFGIFGPTGSGKSSILDAMTLALYGSVERAPNGTQGIMNQAEQQLSVAFEFELSDGANKERYRVERVYKRKSEVAVEQRVSRLIRVGVPDVVLADKAGEVTRAVEALLGLEMADFTRAVVLPQGKFAEFLSLAGRDRRSMLQRLFHLERYGDRLNVSISKRVKDTEGLVRSAEAEQTGLGDASEGALKLAEEANVQAKQQEKLLRVQSEQAEQRRQDVKRRRELTVELERLSEQRTQLEIRQTEMDQLERKLAAAELTERLYPLLEEKNEAASFREQSEAQLAAARREFAEAKQAGALADECLLAAKQSLASQEEPALERLSRLREAQALQEEAARLTAEVHALKTRQASEETELKTAAESLERERELTAKAQRRQEELKQLAAVHAVTPAERQRVSSAVQQEQRVQAFSEQAGRAAEELARCKAAAAAAEQLEREAIAGGRLGMERLQAECREAQRGAGELQLLLNGVRAIEAAVPAQRLAGLLKPGEPCPVCGSAEHPAAVSAVHEEDMATADTLLPEAASLARMLEERQLQLLAVIRQVEDETERLELQPSGEDRLAREYVHEAAAARETRLARALDLLERLRAVQAAAAPMLASAEHLAAQLRSELSRAADSRRKLAGLAADRAAAAAQLERAVAQAAAAADQLQQAERTFLAEFSDMQAGQAQAKQQELHKRDEELADVQERLAKSEAFLAERGAQMERLTLQRTELDKKLAQTSTELGGLTALLAEKTARLRDRIGDGDAGALIREAEQALRSLKLAVEEAERKRDETRARGERAAAALSAAEQKSAHAAERLDKARKAWESALQATGFPADEAWLRETRLSAEDRERLQSELQQYAEERQKLSVQHERVASLLQGAKAADEEHAAAEEAARQAKEALEAAISQAAKAARDYEELSVKHVRWNELEQQRLELSALLGRLQRLQSVLRGNAFVEHMAEEQLLAVSRIASDKLAGLTRGRYRLELDSGGGFVIRDDANGGIRRPVSTLSGGETFLTSLSLALALSAQIQLSGKYPLEFFFLDEGFGTLDPELLDTVVTALEKLHVDKLTVGVISHVPELRARLPRKLVVEPAEPWGRGSRIYQEFA